MSTTGAPPRARLGFGFWSFIVLMLALTALFVALGVWQVNRLAWKEGLIAEVRQRPARGDDERRRYYRVTPFGRNVARAEMARLAELIRLARARGLTPEPA